MSLLSLLLLVAEKQPAALNLKYGGVALGVFLMGIALIRWSVRTYLEGSGIQPVKGLRARKMSPEFRMLQEMGMATGEQLTSMDATERERLFAEAMIRRMAPNPSAAPEARGMRGSATDARGTRGPAPTATQAAPQAPAIAAPMGGFRVSCAPDYLFCPACGVTIGNEKTPIGFITSCLDCKRVLKARLEGARVIIETAGG